LQKPLYCPFSGRSIGFEIGGASKPFIMHAGIVTAKAVQCGKNILET
jgi:hypothetical protein